VTVSTVFVTGINGQDGTLLARRLVAEGAEVHGLVRPHDHEVARGDLPPEVQLHLGDLADPDGLTRTLLEVGPDEVYNLGGVSSVGLSWQEPVLTGYVTGLGAVAVMDAAQRLQDRRGAPVRVLQASSSEIFGTPDRTPQDEGTAVRPLSPYGAAKAYAHEMARIFRSRGLHVSTCILYNHESTLRPPTFVTRKITQAAARIAHEGSGTLTLGDTSVRRDWGWAPDYVDALVRAVRHDVADDFVVATGTTHSVDDFVAAAFAHAGVDDWRSHVEIDPALVRPADAAEMVGDASKARRELGWSPTVTFDELVGRMVEHDLGLLRAGS
jgi:GDPmannose 4,6-dehydratase